MNQGDREVASRLSNATSPYLRQHASNPVDWYPWGDEAWARALAEDKPVLLSIGYASCHWCHVMERESFSDPAIAERLNRDFIAIKVDREERPDLDSLYLEALQTLTGGAGWPLTAFLTPQRKLFFGGTYFPPVARGDLPSFASVLESVGDEWKASRRELERQADGVLREMRDRESGLPQRGALNAELLDQGIRSVLSTADQVNGGFGETPKFPQPWLVDLMLRAASRGPGGAHGVADLTLRRMARGAIYDQVGGGFHRYAVDTAWKVPHFEKMLADNALMARLYTHAWQARKDPLFARIATETLEFVLRELAVPGGGGGLRSGLDSDTDGDEGGFYLWSYEEVASVEPEAVAFFGVTPEGNFEGGLNVLTAVNDEDPRGLREQLAAVRSHRPRPAVDAKVLTGWNGLAVAALAEAGAAFGRADFVESAGAVAGFLLDNVLSSDGTVARLVGGGGGLLEDYAYLADGLLALWEATFDARWVPACALIARRMLDLFWDPDGGGLFASPAGGEELLLRRKDLIDAAGPSPNGMAALALLRLGALLGDPDLSRRGVEILELAQPVMQAIPQESGTLLAALDFYLSGPREIALAGDPSSVVGRSLLREVWTRFLPNRVLAAAGIALPLLEGRSEVGGKPTIYVCEHGTCKRPTSDPTELARQLRVAGPPSSEVVDRAADLARFTLHRMSFFDRLDNPLWIDPLKERGFFTTPPAPIDHYVPGAMGSPPWPDSKYLARMAGMDPFAVHRVAMQIPETGNSLVQEDLADVALALPPDLAADLAARAPGWLSSASYHVMLPRKLGSLVSSLATRGYGGAALDLARALLELLPDVAAEPRAAAGEEGFGQEPLARARYGAWDYEQILKENLPDLVRAVQLPALDLLADLLGAAIELSLVSGSLVSGSLADGSSLWRPAVEADPRNVDRSLRNAAVGALRDASELIVRENPGMLPQVFGALSGRAWPIFRRIGLHVLRLFSPDAPGLAAGQLAERGLLTDPHTSREYLLLARQQLPGLPSEQREQILAWVGAGPDLAAWDGVPGRWASDPEDRLGAEEFARAWSAQRLSLLSPGDASEDLAFTFVPDEPPVDITTPKQAEWIRSAELAEIVRFCTAWRPPGTVGAPTPAGLQRKLVEVITTEPGRFASGAFELRGLPEGYLRAVVIGLREAAKQSTGFAWGPVLDLLGVAAGRSGADAGGRALRISVARCLAAGFAHGESEIPISERSRVWGILGPIATEPEPGPAAEGLQAAVRYALWVRRHLEGQPRGRELAARGWEEMPEVRAVLEAGLEPSGAGGERSGAVQAVYGQWFPWLLMLDPSWAAAHRWAVFPAEATLDHLRQAAWDTYLAVSPVFDQVFELLAGDYVRTAESIAGSEGLTRPQQGFAEHLIALYLRGRITLEGPQSLLGGFFDRAPELQRAHALAYAGQMLQSQPDRIPGEIIRRLQLLWESRVSAARAAAGRGAFGEELAQFGTWFASGKFEGAWAVPQLVELLGLTGRVVNTGKVVERLKTYMETMPYEVARCIAILVANERGAISILGWGQDAQQILSRIVGGADARARDVALDLLDTFDLQPVTELIRWR